MARLNLHESGTIIEALNSTSTAIGLWFLMSDFNIWKDFKVPSRFIQKWNQPLLVRITVHIESFLPIGWHALICWKNPPKGCTILVWVTGHWNIVLTSRNPKNNSWLSGIFGASFGGKDCSFVPIQTVIRTGRMLDLSEAARNFEVFSKIHKIKLKNQKHISVNDFLRPIQWYHSHADPIWWRTPLSTASKPF